MHDPFWFQPTADRATLPKYSWLELTREGGEEIKRELICRKKKTLVKPASLIDPTALAADLIASAEMSLESGTIKRKKNTVKISLFGDHCLSTPCFHTDHS